MKATFGNEKYFRGCHSLFGMGTPMENDANIGWFTGKQNFDKARQLVKESGYDGREVVVLQATNIAYMNNAATLIAQWMREAGFKVSLQASDWGGVVTRRAVKSAPEAGQGGWNVFFTSASVNAFGDPMACPATPRMAKKAGSAGRLTKSTSSCVTVGGGVHRWRAQGHRAGNSGQCLEFRAACLLRPMVPARCHAQTVWHD